MCNPKGAVYEAENPGRKGETPFTKERVGFVFLMGMF